MSVSTSGDAPASPVGPGGPAVPEPVPQLLEETECLRLISPGGIGRLAYSSPDGPAVLPVNYKLYERYAELGIALVMPTARLCRLGGEMPARTALAG